jgi:hypothetical protein
MAQASLTGSDTIIINNYLFTGVADQNWVELTFPNDIAAVKTGKNGNSIYALNETGKQCEVKIRLLRGTKDDSFLNNLLANQQNNFAGTVLLQGQFIKKVGDGAGNITQDTYIVSGGIFTKQVEAKTNSEGDIDQSVAVYTLKFTNAPRVLT